MGRVLRKKHKAFCERNAINSSSSHCGSSHQVIKESVCNSDMESVCNSDMERNLPHSVIGFQQYDRNTPLQPVTSFSLSQDLTTSVALASGTSANVSRANIISNSTVIEILLHLLCREREPDQAKREMLVKALGKGIQHWNSFLYIPLHSLPGLEDFRNGYLKKFEFLFEEIRSQVHTSNASFIADPRLPPSSGSPLTQLAMVDTYEHRIVDDRYSREFTEISLLGKGGFGSVVKAKSRLDGHSYAVKIIIMNKKSNETNQKILREVQALAQLDHPNIVRYHSSWLQMYTLPCQHGSLDGKMQNCRKSRRHRIEKEIKIQELSSSSEHQEIEESSGGIVFEDTSSPKLNTSYKEKHSLPSFITKAGESTDIPEYTFYESKSAVMQRKEQILDNYSIKIENSFKSHSEKKSSFFFHSKNSVNDINSDPSTSINTNGFSFNVSMANDKGKDVYDESFSTSVSSGITSYFKNSLVSHRKHARETHVALFIQMGLCGDTLANWISRRNAEEATGNPLDSVDLEVCIEVFKQILEAVQYIHSKNIIHRDLKPPNIFFSEDGKLIKIGDFGLARNLQESIGRVGGTGDDLSITPFATLTANTCGVGTAMYAAPEVRLSDSYGKKSDMYNLGIILLELIQPFKTGSERVDSINKLKKHKYLDPEVVKRWPDIASWIMQLTSVDQAKRPSATELLKSVSLYISSKKHPRNYTSAGNVGTISPIENVPHLELDCLKGYKNNCDDLLRLDDLKISLPEGSCSNSDPLNSRNSMIDLQFIADIVSENREKDEEIKKLREENSKLLNMVAFLQEQINQTSS